MKKPYVTDSFPPTRAQMDAIKQTIEIVTGRRGGKADLAGLQSMVVSNPPTQAQVDKLRLELVALIQRIEG